MKHHADGAHWELGLDLRRVGNELTEPEAIGAGSLQNLKEHLEYKTDMDKTEWRNRYS